MSENQIIREIRADDIPSLFEVRIATWHNDRGREELSAMGITHESVQRLLADSHRGWLCEVESRVIGFAIGDKSNGEMWVIAVLEEYEGRGIGRRLLSLVEAWLFSEGWHEIWLTTDPDNQRFFRHLWTAPRVVLGCCAGRVAHPSAHVSSRIGY